MLLAFFYVVIDLSALNHPEEPYRALVLYRPKSVKDSVVNLHLQNLAN